MGLETATYVAGLTAAWPLAGDKKNQGDDHLRLIKAVLQSTLPSADRPFYFPKTEVTAGALVLDPTDQNNDILVDTSAGSIAITLPSTLTSADKGWECSIVKTTNDSNAAVVSPATGTIASKVGSTATIRVGQLCDPARFKWNGSGWICYKSGPMIGTTENYDGTSTPPGYLDVWGGTYNSTNFAELFAVTASSTLRDKGGRVEAGLESVATRLTTGISGINGATLGAANGLTESVTIAQAKLPNATLAVSGSLSVLSTVVNIVRGTVITVGSVGSGGSVNTLAADGAAVSQQITSTGSLASGVTASMNGNVAQQTQPIVQPTIVVRKILRAC